MTFFDEYHYFSTPKKSDKFGEKNKKEKKKDVVEDEALMHANLSKCFFFPLHGR